MAGDRLALKAAFARARDPESLRGVSMHEINDACREEAQEIFMSASRKLRRQEANMLLSMLHLAVARGFVAGARFTERQR